ncbi:MAG: type II toxin-antitoxin system RelB/DinJ family antitoxin [Synergistaceae bacterium]|nr:type II toxin-antitoxin system RelB/DinJ family antitoxin [Synergistaceae bacterium]
MQTTINYTCRLDKTLQIKSDALFTSLGMSLNTAINVFLRKAVSIGGFPFDVTLANPGEIPNRDTIEALLEAERIARDPDVKSYTVDEAFEDLDK